MGSLFKQIYRYTHTRPFRHNENLWPYMKIGRAPTGEIASLRYKGQQIPLADLSALRGSCHGPLLLTATGPSVKTIRFKTPSPLPAMGVNGAWFLQQQVGFRFYVVVDMGFYDQKREVIAEIIRDPSLTLFTTAHGIARILDRHGLAAVRCKLALIEDAAFKIYQPKIEAPALQSAYAGYPCAHFAPDRPDIGFTTDIRHGIFDAGTVVYWALQIAAYLGFDEIFILGLDMNNFHQPRFYETEENKQPSYLADSLTGLVMPSLRHAGDILRRQPVRVVNLSPHSAIDESIFEKADYHAIFN
ncbi:sugar glycosyltransferase [Chimaeribacter arupi]|uniref:sugar glycosyltransferase n=1 Tax=Chimaeribacter arupi TaxID=2060066 RepID=UPI000C7DAFDA|nr:sugar glycosyltransferase [Chimaeribacter arupi]MDV5141882.1 sugar glycosyltransferase [Chimaeribacter arupi]PLR29283.1 sugar glycosyltransferase [Chimaeribacter arupi]PLR43540.1 sugar glycosyltransferase [Chimaeribacter arupi]WKZ92300.1 sugar glycosyltransferase [Chimaeribacter arupi]